MKTDIRKINFSVILRIIGWLLMIESFFMLLPLFTAWYYGEADIFAFAVGVGLTLVSGIGLTFGLRGRTGEMRKHEGFLLTALVWVVFSIYGMVPFILSDSAHMTVSDAFFESMSGFTTTGCTISTSVEHFSRSVNIWRALIQWIGGMGIILFTLAVLPMLNNSGGMQMFNAEVTGITHDKLRPRVSQTAKSLWGVYFLLTSLLVLLLWLGPMSLFNSVCYGFSTMSTGGFAPHDSSLAFFHSDYVNVVVMIFMFLGGTSFALIFHMLHGNFGPIWRNDVFKAYIGVVLVAYAIFAVNIFIRGQMTTWQSVTIEPMFEVISTLTSTGLSVCDFQVWGSFAVALMIVLMFSGACAGSTSGGAKIDRLLFLIKNNHNEIYRCIHPNAVMGVRINDKVISPDIVSKVIAFLCIYVIVILVGGIMLTALGLPLVDAFFSSFSCVSNTGFGAGVTGSAENFSNIPDAGKWILSGLMLVGRLELFTVLILFTRGFWQK